MRSRKLFAIFDMVLSPDIAVPPMLVDVERWVRGGVSSSEREGRRWREGRGEQ